MTWNYLTPQAWGAFTRLARVRAGDDVTWDLTLADATQLANVGLILVGFDGDRREVDLSFTPFGEDVADRVLERTTL